MTEIGSPNYATNIEYLKRRLEWGIPEGIYIYFYTYRRKKIN
jgi:hypothetical protein